jgi:hypothetical protein
MMLFQSTIEMGWRDPAVFSDDCNSDDGNGIAGRGGDRNFPVDSIRKVES